MVVEVDSGQLGVDSAIVDLQQLQTLLTTAEHDNLAAIVSLNQMVVLRPAFSSLGRWEPESQRNQINLLLKN